MDLELEDTFKANFKKSEKISNFQVMISMIVSLYDNYIRKSDTVNKVMIEGVDEKSAKAYEKRKQEEDKLLNSLEEKRLKQLKEELDAEVVRYIDNRDEKKLISVIERGYKLNDLHVGMLFEHNAKFPSVIVQEAINEHFRNEVVDIYCDTFTEFFKQVEDLEKDEIKDALTQLSSINSSIWKRIKYDDINSNPEQCLKLLELTTRLQDFISDYSFSGKFPLKISLEKINDSLEKKYKSDFEDIHEEKMKKFSEVLNGFDSMKENIVSGIIKNAKNFNESDIPKASRDIINAIKSKYHDINSDNDNNLNIQQSLDLENLYKKRLPQIIEEYLTISPSYKQRLISHNDSPDVLLLDSLQGIKDKMDSISYDIEEGKHRKMKTSNRYLKNI